ncbi:MAG: hypothetical protein GY906_37260 [bacterium]|nr:hypothetical protein [bacterium]
MKLPKFLQGIARWSWKHDWRSWLTHASIGCANLIVKVASLFVGPLVFIATGLYCAWATQKEIRDYKKAAGEIKRRDAVIDFFAYIVPAIAIALLPILWAVVVALAIPGVTFLAYALTKKGTSNG